MSIDRFKGCLLGLALGDAVGAPHEGGPLERLLWRLIGRTRTGEMRWTDDTQMSLDVADSLIAHGRVDPDDLARRFARSYRWSRGYGPGAARLLKRIARGEDWRQANRAIYRDGSFGNGAAMRAPVVGLFYADRPGELPSAVRASAEVTHAHALALEGAVLVASATAVVTTTSSPTEILREVATRSELESFTDRLAVARAWVEAGELPGRKEVRRCLGAGVAAAESCVTAIYVAVRFLDRRFAEMLSFVASMGGDVDTVGAMAGSIWGAANGASRLPADLVPRLEQRDRLEATAEALHERA